MKSNNKYSVIQIITDKNTGKSNNFFVTKTIVQITLEDSNTLLKFSLPNAITGNAEETRQVLHWQIIALSSNSARQLAVFSQTNVG